MRTPAYLSGSGTAVPSSGGRIARQSHLPALARPPRSAAAWRWWRWWTAPPMCRPSTRSRCSPDANSFAIWPLDFIDICTPTASHLELTLWGLRARLPVVCEKPVGPHPRRGGPHRRRGADQRAHRDAVPSIRHNPVWMKSRSGSRAAPSGGGTWPSSRSIAHGRPRPGG